jgi:UDP-sulfoquinovose synthase
MRILIAGIDGYLGWSLACYLGEQGHRLAGIDNGLRRTMVDEIGSTSAVPIKTLHERRLAWEHRFGRKLHTYTYDLTTESSVSRVIAFFKPEAIVHLGEIPSAPYSMIPGNEWPVQQNNLGATWSLMNAIRHHAPDCHLVKLGSMGEYGTPDGPIPEASSKDFPRQPGSFYHASKVHGTVNLALAADVWGLSSTDIMQGVVFGTTLIDYIDDPVLATRLDFDECFGTAINRFVCQAVIGHPLTIYGAGGQTRGYLPLADSMRCIELLLQNPPYLGEHRVVNQFAEVHSIKDLARTVARLTGAEVKHYENPRREAEAHQYDPVSGILAGLGYTPSTTVDDEVSRMVEALTPHQTCIAAYESVLIPCRRWDGTNRRSEPLIGVTS